MVSMLWSETERSKKRHPLVSFLLICGFIIQGEQLFAGLGVNGQMVLEAVEARSSPSYINATKGSSVWLHWNYIYMGDGTYNGTTTFYREQAIVFNSTSQSTTQVLAKRIGQNGTLVLESPLPVPFTGRVEVISSNSTLVIHNLQYNDSMYQFSSHVTVNTSNSVGAMINTYNLSPVVSIRVKGIPTLMRQPPRTLEVAESSALQLIIYMDGNPKPSADFEWSHLTSSSPTNVPSVQLYPFSYSSTYAMSNIPSQYCGRLLQVRAKNSIGSSSVMRSTNVTVLLKLDNSFGLRAEKLTALRCVEVRWNQVQSGACHVLYDVTFRNTSGTILYQLGGYNVGRMRTCDVSTYNTVNDVKLTVSFKNASANATTTVTDAVVTTSSTTPSITPSTTSSITPSITPSTTPSITPSTTSSITPSITPSTTPSITPSTTLSNSPSITPSTISSITPSRNPTTPSNKTQEKSSSTSGSNAGLSAGLSIGIPLLLCMVAATAFWFLNKHNENTETNTSRAETPRHGKRKSQTNEGYRHQSLDSKYSCSTTSIDLYGKVKESGRELPQQGDEGSKQDNTSINIDDIGCQVAGNLPTSDIPPADKTLADAPPPLDTATEDDPAQVKPTDNVPAADVPPPDTANGDDPSAKPADNVEEGDLLSNDAVPESVPSGDEPSTDAPVDDVSTPPTKRKGSKRKK